MSEGLDPQTRRMIHGLARDVSGLRRKVRALSRSPQLPNSSVDDDGALVFKDHDGNHRLRVGGQGDGTTTIQELNGPTPPAPAGCTAAGGQLSVTAATVGAFVDGVPAPLDFDATEVHADADAAFEPAAATRTGTITAAGGASITFAAAAGTLYVRFLTRSKSGQLSPASDPIQVEVTAAVDPAVFDQLHDDLQAAQGRLDQARTDLDAAEHDLYEPGGTVDLVKTTLTGQIATGDADTLQQAATDAQEKADAARTAAIAAAASDAQDKADAAQQAATTAAAADAQAKAAAAQAAATTAAAADAKAKADAAQQAAVDAAAQTAQLKADGAQQAAIDAAAADAKAKADAAQAAATTAAAADAKAKADAAQAAAVAQAADDATTKADAAKDAAIAALSPALSSAQQAAVDAMTAAQAAQATADGAIRTYYQDDAPWPDGSTQPDSVLGDMWYSKTTGQARRWNGSQWQVIEDNAIGAALAAAQGAQATADGKITAFYQGTQPTDAESDLNDLWFNTSDGNKPRYCSSTSTTPHTWSLVQDASIATGDAATAAAAAADAKAKADAAQAAATTAAAADAKAKADAAQAAATAAAATDAQDKADAAQAAALAAAKTYAEAQATGASADALAAAKTDAQTKADAAKAAAISAAAADAKAKADAAQAAATAAAAADAKAKADAVAAEAVSRGADLVTNGTGYLGNNTNFPSFTFNPADAPTGASGSFVSGTGYHVLYTDKTMPVDVAKRYILASWIRDTGGAKRSGFYIGISPYDGQGAVINPLHYYYTPASNTTLAAPLKKGDTSATVIDGSGFGMLGNSYLLAWKYVDANGREWPVDTYSRWISTQIASINGNVITFSSGWAGPDLPAGHPVANSHSGGTYMYCVASSAQATAEWVRYASQPVGGVHDGRDGAATTRFPPGTASVRMVFLLNYAALSDPESNQAIAGVSMSEAAAAQATADGAAAAAATAASKADLAQATASGKNGIYWFQTDATDSTPGTRAGDVWWKYKITDNKLRVLAQWRWDGAHWVSSTLDETFIPQINIGTGTAGALDVSRLNVNTTQSDIVVVGDGTNTVLIADGAVTAKKANVNDLTAAIAKIIQLDVGQLTVTGTSSFAQAVVDRMWANIFAAHKVTADEVDAQDLAAAVGTFVKVKAEHIEGGDINVALNIIAGGKIIAGNAEVGDGIQTFTTDIDGNRVPSTQLGVPGSPDALTIGDVASISAEGDVAGTTVASDGDMSVAGMPLVGKILDPAAPAGIMDQLSRGVQVYSFRDLPAINATISQSTNGPLGQIDVILPPGRIIEMKMPWRVNPSKQSGTSPAELLYGVRAFWQYTTDGSEPPTPGTSAAELFADSSARSPVGGGSGVSGILTAEVNTFDAAYTTRVKILFIAFTSAGTQLTPSLFAPFDWFAYFADRGPAVTPLAAGAPGTGSAKQFTTTWTATDSRTWGSDGNIYGDAHAPIMYQGVSAAAGLTHAACVFNGNATGGDEAGKSMQTALTGATILKIEFGVQAITWKTGKGEIQLRKFSGNLINSPDNVVGSVGTKRQYTAGNQWQWTQVPTNYVSPTDRGVYLNTADWPFPNSYGAFASAYYGTAALRPQCRVTYTRTP